MVEFAIVLFIKQRREQGFGITRKLEKSARETGTIIITIHKAGNDIADWTCRGRNVLDNGIKKVGVGNEVREEYHRDASVLTNKIDLASIILFSISYLIFNCIYCLS